MTEPVDEPIEVDPITGEPIEAPKEEEDHPEVPTKPGKDD